MARDSFTITRLSSVPDRDIWRSIRELCCRTGDNGKPIAAGRWDFFAKIWIDPYERLLPHWTYVAKSESSLIAYLTGCPDSEPFARAAFYRCTLPLLLAVAAGRHRRNLDAARFARRDLGLEDRVERCFAPEIRRRIAHEFPAHLHMNVDSRFRGLGLGRRLIERYFADLKAIEKPGVHLYCGPDPVGFYLAVGFREIGAIVFRGLRVHVLGYSFQADVIDRHVT